MGLRDISIRKFRPEDAKAVTKIINSNLINTSNDGNYAEVAPKFILTLSNERKMYVALNDNTVVGTASIDNDTISAVFIGEQYHNQKVEEALIGLMEEIAANNGFKLIKLEAGVAAEKLYERLGYSSKGEVSSNELGRNILMEKYLF